MSYLRYLCLLEHSGVQHLLCCGVFVLFCFFFFFGGGGGGSSCVPYNASFPGLSFFDCPFGILYRLLRTKTCYVYTYIW